MATEVTGQYFSDLLVGQKEDVSDTLLELVPAATPFLTSVGFPGFGTAYNTSHTYLDDAYIPTKTTLNGSIAATTTTTFVLTDAIAKPGCVIQVGDETILLGASTNNLTFTGCTRSVGTGAAAAYATGLPVVVLPKGEAQGAAAGDADVGYEPRTVTNYVQEFEKVMDIPTITQSAQRYGRPGTAYDDDAVKKMRDLKIGLENTMIMGTATAPVGSTGTAGWLNGVWERVVGTNTSAMSTTDFTHTTMRTIAEAIAPYYDPAEQINIVGLMPLHQTFVFDSWLQAHVVEGSAQTKYGVKCKTVQIGTVSFDIIAHNRFYNSALFYQPKYIKPLWYNQHAPKHEMLAKDGRRIRGMISCAATIETYCPEAHYTVTGLAVS